MSLAAQVVQINVRLEAIIDNLSGILAQQSADRMAEAQKRQEEMAEARRAAKRERFEKENPNRTVILPGITDAGYGYRTVYDLLLAIDNQRRKVQGDSYSDPSRGGRYDGGSTGDLRFTDGMLTVDITRAFSSTDPSGKRTWGLRRQNYDYEEIVKYTEDGKEFWDLGGGILAIDRGSALSSDYQERLRIWREQGGQEGQDGGSTRPQEFDPLAILWGRRGGVNVAGSRGENDQDISFKDRLRNRDTDPKWWDYDTDYDRDSGDAYDRNRNELSSRDQWLNDYFEKLFKDHAGQSFQDGLGDYDWDKITGVP